MKQSDVISVFLIGLLGFIISYFVVNMFFDPDKEKVSFYTMSGVDNNVGSADELIFNTNAINPTVEVYIGNCVDIDGNGVLDDEEKVACKQIDVKD